MRPMQTGRPLDSDGSYREAGGVVPKWMGQDTDRTNVELCTPLLRRGALDTRQTARQAGDYGARQPSFIWGLHPSPGIDRLQAVWVVDVTVCREQGRPLGQGSHAGDPPLEAEREREGGRDFVK